MAAFPDQARTLGSLLRAPHRALSRRLYGALARHGFPEVRPAHGALLRHLAPGGSRLTELAAMADMTKQSMAYLVESLAQAGYLQLLPDPEDGRAKLVRLTARGRKLMERLLAISAELEAEIARAMGRRELDTLRTQLEKLDVILAEQA